MLFVLNHSDVSRESEVSLQVYLRKSTQTGNHTNDMGNDVYLGGIKLKPNFSVVNVRKTLLNILYLHLICIRKSIDLTCSFFSPHCRRCAKNGMTCKEGPAVFTCNIVIKRIT